MKNCLALATCFYPESSPEIWKTAAAAGFTDAEIDTNNNLTTAEILANSQKIYDDLKAGGLAPTSLHLPFGNQWDISSADDAVRAYALTEMNKFIAWAGEHQIPYVILHPSYEPIADTDRPTRMKNAVASIARMGAVAKECGVIVAVENLPRTCLGNCADDMIELLGENEAVGICFDVNHLLKESHKDFVAKTGKYIVTTHLSDYDFVDEKHWMPGEGDIDWKELKELLDGVGYEGRYLFELGAARALPSRERTITAKELADRFAEVIR